MAAQGWQRAGQALGLLRRVLVRLGATRRLTEACALVGLVLATSGLARPAALPLLAAAWCLASGRGLALQRRALPEAVGPTGTGVLARVLVLLGLTTLARPGPLGWVATTVLALVLLAESALVPLARAAVPVVVHLPGVHARHLPVLRPQRLFVLDALAVAVLGAAALLHAGGPLLLTLACLGALPLLVVGLDTGLRLLGRRRAKARVREALEAYGPTFLLHVNAPHGSEHQVRMWLPYLERLGRPFVVVLRNPSTFAAVSSQTDRPVLLCRSAADLEVLTVPSLRTVFYVNTSPVNEHMLRFLGPAHVQLNHGDSDKAASYRRVFRAYDRNFVAGQAAVDRFAEHGVRVPAEAFVVVGRPQVDRVTVRPGPAPVGRPPVVLYAPTWNGYHADSRYSSLPFGVALVEALLARGCTVVFRPHPWVWRDRRLARCARQVIALLRDDAARTGRPHVFGPAAETALDVAGCFNLSDALVSDVSSVVGDYLHSEKPFAVVDVSGGAEEDVLAELPLARAGYLLRPGSPEPDLDRVLDDLLVRDPLAGRRSATKEHYLGPSHGASADQAFLDAARPYV